ncbi:hypothetical protein [Methanolacinia paynteri]|uniref:hypothetical protein n=1 Tax=Methanolacinia paynteri TaxID=230356 RepID=UPI00064E2D7A|nr:hypothetical protein [Methanolacinia paynteri]
MPENMLMAGPGLNELLFSINGELHTTHPDTDSGPGTWRTTKLLGGRRCVYLYPPPVHPSENDHARAWKTGKLLAENSEADIPTARAWVSDDYLSLVVYDMRSQLYFICPHSWACQVACRKRKVSKMIKCEKEMIP